MPERVPIHNRPERSTVRTEICLSGMPASFSPLKTVNLTPSKRATLPGCRPKGSHPASARLPERKIAAPSGICQLSRTYWLRRSDGSSANAGRPLQ